MPSIRTYLSRVKKKGLKTMYLFSDHLLGGDKYIRYTHLCNGFHNPNYHFDKKKIAFVHIPKTGGTTLGKMLMKDEHRRFINLTIHRPVSVHCDPVDYNYITILRDPISRVWSQYQHVLRSHENYPYHKYAKQGLLIFLEKCWAVRNLVCRYISGDIEIEPDNSTMEKALCYMSHFSKILHFDDFNNQVSNYLGEHQISFDNIPNERKSNYPSPTEEDKKLIIKYNQWDIALYESWKNRKQ